jgi:hypothetical protein
MPAGSYFFNKNVELEAYFKCHWLYCEGYIFQKKNPEPLINFQKWLTVLTHHTLWSNRTNYKNFISSSHYEFNSSHKKWVKVEYTF